MMLGRVEEPPTSNVSTATPASSEPLAQSDKGALNQRPAAHPRSATTDENPNWGGFGSNMYGVPVKDEPMDDTRNDSGVTSGSDCPSVSPASDRSGTSHLTTSPGPSNIYPFNGAKREQFSDWYTSHVQNSASTRQSASRNTLNPKPSSVNAVSSKIDENSNDFDDEGIRNPKVNSHGRVKVHRCKQCEFYSYTKLEFWEHSRVHIKGDKILKCPKCPFVTEYKHHLEYHLLNHAGAKPFKCSHCDYSCVNKSMLNSHLKSHSKIYQYRCADCNYETKYCHSLKLHLRKYAHKPDVVLHPDGTPNPYPVIDVYGTRRGPKVKKVSPTPSPNNVPAMPPALPVTPMEAQATHQMNLMNPLINSQAPMMPFPLLPLPGFPGTVTPEIMMNFQNMFRERLEELAKQNGAFPRPGPEPIRESSESEALDLTNKSGVTSENGESDNEDETMTTVFSNVEVVENQPDGKKETEDDVIVRKENFACQPCGISFGDEVMYRIHIGYHTINNPFTCNMCGEQCSNKLNFFIHMTRAAH